MNTVTGFFVPVFIANEKGSVFMKRLLFLLLALSLAGCASVPKLTTYINAPSVAVNH